MNRQKTDHLYNGTLLGNTWNERLIRTESWMTPQGLMRKEGSPTRLRSAVTSFIAIPQEKSTVLEHRSVAAGARGRSLWVQRHSMKEFWGRWNCGVSCLGDGHMNWYVCSIWQNCVHWVNFTVLMQKIKCKSIRTVFKKTLKTVYDGMGR